MVYNVLIGEGNYTEAKPQKFAYSPSYTDKTISMSSPNIVESVLMSNFILPDNHKLFGCKEIGYKAKFNHINLQCDIVCGYAPSTTGISEYKMYRKPGTNLVFGAIYNAGLLVYPSTIPSDWVDYAKDVYMIDYIAVSFDDLRFGHTSNNDNNAVVVNFGCDGGQAGKSIYIGYKHENQIATGTYLIDVFIGERIDSTDYGIRYATVYEADVGTDNLFTYQVPTKQPYFVRYELDESVPRRIIDVQTDLKNDITEIQNILGPFLDRIGSIRSQYTTR